MTTLRPGDRVEMNPEKWSWGERVFKGGIIVHEKHKNYYEVQWEIGVGHTGDNPDNTIGDRWNSHKWELIKVEIPEDPKYKELFV